MSPSLIVIESLARCFRGDDNLVRDVSQAIANIDRVHEKTGAAVLIVYHSRKDDAVEREGSAHRGALDVIVQVRNEHGGLVMMHCGKMNERCPRI